MRVRVRRRWPRLRVPTPTATERRRRSLGAPLPPPLPPGRALVLPGRGEVFFRHHPGGREAHPGAPLVVLLHGWTASADLQWFTAYDALGARFPFVAIDHRGHGRGLRSEQAFTLEDAADDAAALVRALGGERVVLVGYSMGGPIALLVAQRHPDLVAGLVLAATSLEFSDSRVDRLRWRSLPVFESTLRSRVARWFTNKVIVRQLSSSPSLDRWVPWLVAETRRGDPAAIADAGRALARFDARPWAGALGVPTTVVLTTADTLVVPRRQWALATALQAEVFELDSDHQAGWRAPEAFAEALRRAVDATAARVPSVVGGD